MESSDFYTHRSETYGFAERAARRTQEERLLYCCNQVRFYGMLLSAEKVLAKGIWKGDILVAERGVGEPGRVRSPSPKTQCKEVLTPRRSEDFKLPVASGTAKKFRKQTTNSENPLKGGNNL